VTPENPLAPAHAVGEHRRARAGKAARGRVGRASWIVDGDPFEGGTMGVETPRLRYFHLELQGGIAVVNFVDIQIGPDARDQLYALVEDDHHERILLDFSNIWALSSSALGILTNLQRKVEAAGGQMKLCRLNPNLIQLMRMTKLEQFFEVHDSREDASRAF
jgi:anti-sigma B factor antagonist